jgi:hypothetical protein
MNTTGNRRDTPRRRPFAPSSARSRSTLLAGLLAFVALQAGLAAAVESWLPELRDPYYVDKAARLRRRLATSHPRPLTVVMLGSSRTTFALKGGDVEPRLGEEVQAPVALYNFGLIGAGPLTELMTLRRLLADGIRPDLLLVEIHPCLLSGDVPWEVRRLTAGQVYRRELSFLARYGAPRRQLRRDWWLAEAVPWYSHRFAIVSRTLPYLLPWQLRQDLFWAADGSGWVESPLPPPTPDVRQRALDKARREYYAKLQDFHLGRGSCQALREILETCRREHIGVALVWVPEGPVFRSWYTPQAEARTRAFLKECDRAYGAPLIDARDWVPEDEFTDSHHLRTPGARRFSERLAREALPPLLRGLARATDEPQAIPRRSAQP